MPICGYLVFTERGRRRALAERLAALPGCDVVPAENQDLLLLVTDASGPGEDEALRRTVTEMDGVSALLLTFGEVPAGTPGHGAARP